MTRLHYLLLLAAFRLRPRSAETFLARETAKQRHPAGKGVRR